MTCEFKDIAILYRMNAQAGPIQRMLSKAGIPYNIQGGMSFWKQREVKDILAFLSWLANPLDFISLERASKNLKMKCAPPSITHVLYKKSTKSTGSLAELITIYKVMAEKKESVALKSMKRSLLFAKNNATKNIVEVLDNMYKEFDTIGVLKAEDLKGTSKDVCREDSATTLYEIAKESNCSISKFLDNVKLDNGEEDNDENGVVLSTLHKSKGREWPIVFLVGCTEGILPSKMVINEIHSKYDTLTSTELKKCPEYRQELNAMYVGQTRAKNVLCMTHVEEHIGYDGKAVKNSSLRRSELLDSNLDYIKNNGKLKLLEE